MTKGINVREINYLIVEVPIKRDHVMQNEYMSELKIKKKS